MNRGIPWTRRESPEMHTDVQDVIEKSSPTSRLNMDFLVIGVGTTG